VPAFKKDKCCLKDASPLIHETSYLFEINKNNKKFDPHIKNGDTNIIDGLSSSEPDF
jgi:hypothetical protein